MHLLIGPSALSFVSLGTSPFIGCSSLETAMTSYHGFLT